MKYRYILLFRPFIGDAMVQGLPLFSLVVEKSLLFLLYINGASSFFTTLAHEAYHHGVGVLLEGYNPTVDYNYLFQIIQI
jgi:hypothetical protein